MLVVFCFTGKGGIMFRCLYSNKRMIASVFCMVIPLYLLLSPGSVVEAQDAGKKPVRVNMTVTLKFSPDKVTVYQGDTVEWKNQSPFTHTVTDDPALATNKTDSVLPEGAIPFNSGNIEPNETYRYTFTVPGTYHYFCIPHEKDKMKGEVIVVPLNQQS